LRLPFNRTCGLMEMDLAIEHAPLRRFALEAVQVKPWPSILNHARVAPLRRRCGSNALPLQWLQIHPSRSKSLRHWGMRSKNRLAGLRTAVMRLAFCARQVNFPGMVTSEINWPEDLRAADNSGALAELRGILLNGLRVALRDRSDVSEAHLEDFAQEALLRVLYRLDQFAGRSKFTTWAHTIAINTAFTELRRKRWRDVSLDALTADGKQLAEASVMPGNALGEDEERSRLIAALRRAMAEKLTAKQRTAIAGELQDLPFDQIVALLGTNRNAAYKLLHDARRALKAHLAAEGISPEVIRTAFAS
jgi:RNA polymerase sigma-70 factor (ECF subfamily)